MGGVEEVEREVCVCVCVCVCGGGGGGFGEGGCKHSKTQVCQSVRQSAVLSSHRSGTR